MKVRGKAVPVQAMKAYRRGRDGQESEVEGEGEVHTGFWCGNFRKRLWKMEE
jgi:hypothetical protein